MLTFAILLTAGGLVAFLVLVVFLCENLMAVLAAVPAGQAAFATGGGWPGAIFAALVTFALISVALRLAVCLLRPWALRVAFTALIVVPAGAAAFLLADAILQSFVPIMGWRIVMSIFAAFVVGTSSVRRPFC